MVKRTYLLDPVLTQNIAYFALAENMEQSDVVRNALVYYLENKGLNPLLPPRFSHQT